MGRMLMPGGIAGGNADAEIKVLMALEKLDLTKVPYLLVHIYIFLQYIYLRLRHRERERGGGERGRGRGRERERRATWWQSAETES